MLVKKAGRLAVKVTDATGGVWSSDPSAREVRVTAEGPLMEVIENAGSAKEKLILFVNAAAVVIEPR